MEQRMVLGGIEWHPIGQTSNQLILYHPPSHALSVQPHPTSSAASSSRPRPLLLPYRADTESDDPIETIRATCPYCQQTLPEPTAALFNHSRFQHLRSDSAGSSSTFPGGEGNTVTGGYFQILERAHEGSRPPSPRLREKSPSVTPQPEVSDSDELEDLPGKGYYERFFREESRLGIGAEGSVYLATHVIGGNVLGTYAVKKIAVGTSKSYLVRMLREVRLLETLRHPNIIPYHHAWIEHTRFSSFGPPINALHVLMMYATAGNLDSFLITRSHSSQPSRPDLTAGDIADSESIGQLPRAERIKAFKKRRQSGNNRKKEETRGVLLLGLEEILTLFGDIVNGLAFLHGSSILHLDLKCSNVLLHWDDGRLIPKAMLSDFGTSEEMLRGKRERTGHTGTMEYMAPETLMIDGKGSYRPSDSHADMWSLGMILHKLLFLHLPYSDTDDFEQLQEEILAYQGFMPSAELIDSCRRRHLPRDLLLVLSSLLNTLPESRPSAEKVRAGIQGLVSDTSRPALTPQTSSSSLSSRLGGLVTRFKGPRRSESETMQREDSTDRKWETVSPVRSMLALPSPPLESSNRVSPFFVDKLYDLRRFAYIYLFVIKMLSFKYGLYPASTHWFWTNSLLCFDILTFHTGSWSSEMVSDAVHLALLLYWWINAKV
ncbi:kinase-like domain-containing protein [Kockovaella imperatae]|uniref:Kinase-like domain-containing protein n=1 Tax=Kockovaella imperatae TaxID=4999 RepID=A0A1Y1U8M5_9TREE|nr:kinase-like domain-containing protein [Kockovaella imperatae]ORX34368.1 kinase-like domain-containing protein [Kockovaella imperatae]